MEDEKNINMTNVTIEDCIEALRYRGKRVVLNNGNITGFEQDENGYEYTRSLYKNIFAF